MQRVIVFGCQQIAVEFLDHLGGLSDTTVPLVVTSESEHDELFGYPSLRAKAEELGVEAVNPGRVSEIIERVADIQPDAIFSLYYRKILPLRLLEIAEFGCFNIHPGLLPRYRGPTPTAWAILKGEESFGITIHLMDENVDTGDILVQREYEIYQEETGYELHLRAMGLGAALLRENFAKIMNRELRPQEQIGPASYFGKLNPSFTIDWQEKAQRIKNSVRVYSKPYASAETRLGNQRLLIDKVRVLEEESRYLLQGRGKIVDALADGTPVVAAADGFLVLEDFDFSPPLAEAERSDLLRVGAKLG